MSPFRASGHSTTRAPRPDKDETVFRFPATCADGKSDNHSQ